MPRPVLFILTALISLSLQAQDVKIALTGKLLGYARTPDVQRVRQAGWLIDGSLSTDGLEGCKKPAKGFPRLYRDVPGGEKSKAATFLLDHLKEKSPDLVLGTGDNFAMDFNGRFVVATVCSDDGIMRDEYIAKDVLEYLDSRYTQAPGYWLDLRQTQSTKTRTLLGAYEASGPGTIPGDNVASFLSAANYDALVPGKHDFYYGPERLRELAALLAHQTKPTQMLGANLIIQSTAMSPPAALDEAILAKQRNFAVHLAGSDMQWDIPSTVLPWARTFHVKKYLDSHKTPLVDPAKGATLYLAKTRDHVDTKAPHFTLDATVGDNDITYRIRESDVLPASVTFQLCAPLSAPRNPNQADFCAVFDVAAPFFQYPDYSATDALKTQSATPRVLPWVSTDKAVVMGVVEPQLESYIGSLNSVYRNSDSGISTKVVAIDPKVALTQLVEYCIQVKACSENQRRILLAQMPRDEASVLNDRFGATPPNRKFDLVIAEADSRFFTGKVDVTCLKPPCSAVLVPDELTAKEDEDEKSAKPGGQGRFHARIHVAELRTNSGLSTDIIGPSEPLYALPAVTPCLAPIVHRYLESKHYIPLPDDALTPAVLLAMRERLHADVAVLQERDFFEADEWMSTCATSPIQAATAYQQERATLEQILWKGDFLVRRTITGDKLKSALAESDKLVDQEKMYQVQSESGRSLRTFGLYQDPDSKNWYVNGAAIDDKALYSVAMSDHLASGNTGYVDFKTDDGAEPSESDRLLRVTKVVMAEMTSRESDQGIDPNQYLDGIQQKLPAQPPKAPWLSQLYTTLRKSATQRHPDLKDAGDLIGQTRPYWRIFVDKGSFEFTDYHNNVRALDDLTARFGANTDSGVTTPRSRKMPIGLQFEVRREMGTWHLFSRTELDYELEKVQQDGAVERYVTTYGNDTISQENGIRFAFHQTMRSRPWNGAFFSVFGETNPKTPHNGGYQTGVSAACPATQTCPTTLTFESDVARTSRIMAKFGLRRESEENWGEVGITGGRAIRPSAFSVAENGTALTTPAPCAFSSLDSKGDSVTLADCLKTFKIAVTDASQADSIAQSLRLISYTATKPESGVFVNFNYRLALPENFLFKDLYFEQRGTMFFKSGKDLVSDTRINEQFTFGPTVAISSKLPGLTLKPSFKLFFFESKVSNYRLTARTIDLSLDYRFDWKTGLKWKNVLRYGRP